MKVMKFFAFVGKSTGIILLSAWLLLQTISLADEQSVEAQLVESLTPGYVNNLVVQSQGRSLQIRGQVQGNHELSDYMRLLSDRVGFASLESLRREGQISRFVLLIKIFDSRQASQG